MNAKILEYQFLNPQSYKYKGHSELFLFFYYDIGINHLKMSKDEINSLDIEEMDLYIYALTETLRINNILMEEQNAKITK